MDLMPNYGKYLLIAIVASIFVYAVGHLLMSLVSVEHDDKYKRLFLKLTVGTSFVVAAYAVLRTGGNTIMMGLLVLFVLALGYLIAKGRVGWSSFLQNVRRTEVNGLLIYAGYLLVTYTALYVMVVGLGDRATMIPYDFSFHSAVGNVMDMYGVETNNVVYGMDGVDSGRFYHFTEIWYGVMVSAVFGVSVYYAMMIVVVPLVMATVLMGCYALCGRIIKGGNITLWLLPLLMLFPMRNIVYPLFMTGLRLGSANLDGLLSDYAPRVVFVYLGLIWFFLNVDKSRLVERIVPLAFICFLYPPVMPAVVVGVALFLVVRYVYVRFKKMDYDGRDFAFSWLLMLVVTLFSVVYLYLNRSVENRELGMMDVVRGYYFESGDVVYSLKLLVKKAAMTVVWLSISGVALGYFFLRERSAVMKYGEAFVVCIAIIISGLCGFVSVWFIADSFQIYELPLFTITSFFTFIAVCLMLASECKVVRVLGGLFVVVVVMSYVFIPKNSPTDYSQSEKLYDFIGTDRYTVACIDGDTLKRNVNSVLDGTEFYHVRRFSDSFLPISLFSFNREVTSDEQIDFEAIADNAVVTSGYRFNGDVESSAFYRFAMEHRDEDLNRCKAMFIKERKIDYVVCGEEDEWLLEEGLPISDVLRFENGKQILKLKW